MDKNKFIKAMLDVCDNPSEIDEVFDLFKIDSISDRCNFLKEEGVKYFDLPKDDNSQYEILKMMYTEPHTKSARERVKVKKFIKVYTE